MDEKMAVGRRIKELRTKRGLLLRALADLSRLSTNAISLIEHAPSVPNTIGDHLVLANRSGSMSWWCNSHRLPYRLPGPQAQLRSM